MKTIPYLAKLNILSFNGHYKKGRCYSRTKTKEDFQLIDVYFMDNALKTVKRIVVSYLRVL